MPPLAARCTHWAACYTIYLFTLKGNGIIDIHFEEGRRKILKELSFFNLKKRFTT